MAFEDEINVMREEMKWMTVAKIHMQNQFTYQAFIANMSTVWSPVKDNMIRAVQHNLFTTQCFCFGERMKVTGGGQWLFTQFPSDGQAL